MEEMANEKFPHRIAFNLLPEIGKDSGNGGNPRALSRARCDNLSVLL